MKNLSRRNKRAVSTIVAYVLLISISIALSVLVYNWLKFYIGDEELRECPDGVSVIIQDYKCVSGEGGYLNVTVKNKGRFTIDGFVLRVHNKTGADMGFYVINNTGVSIPPGGEATGFYFFSDTYSGNKFTTISLVEVQPFLIEGDKISCKSFAFQKIVCS
jgi:hypothetical protein